MVISNFQLPSRSLLLLERTGLSNLSKRKICTSTAQPRVKVIFVGVVAAIVLRQYIPFIGITTGGSISIWGYTPVLFQAVKRLATRSLDRQPPVSNLLRFMPQMLLFLDIGLGYMGT